MTILNRHERRKKITIARRLEKKQAKHRIRRLVLQMAQHHHNHKWELLKAAEAEIAAERNEY